MRAFWTSLLCIVLLLAAWWFYAGYSDEKLHYCIGELDNTVSSHIKNEDWEAAEQSFDDVKKSWDKYKTRAAFFFHTSAVNEIDYNMERVNSFMDNQNKSEAMSELACLTKRLKCLGENEKITWGNVF